MARGRKREAGVIVTATPIKKRKQITGYQSRKKVSTKVSDNSQRRTVVMPYSAKSTTAITADTVSSTVLNGNDIFTLQPMGRDQMFGLFDKAYVKSSKLKVWVAPSFQITDLTNDLFRLNVWCDTNSAASGSIVESTQRCEAHGGKTICKVLQTAYQSAVGVSIAYDTPMYIEMEAFTKQVTGHGFGSDELSQTNGAAPENKWYWHIEKYGGVTSQENMLQEYILDFDTIFYDPKELNVS